MFEVSSAPVLGPGGAIELGVVAFEDVSSRLDAEEALRRAQRLEAVGQLTGGVAHDFNNLLTAILGTLELLSRHVQGARANRLVQNAARAADRGAKLTAQLLAFARKQRLQMEPVDVEKLVRSMAMLLRGTLGGTIEIDLSHPPDLWPALADPTQLELLVLNLAINARDAMPEGGRLTISSQNVTVRRGSRPEDPPPGNFVALTISDTGVGMSPAVLARAFEPFFTTKEVGKGTGLGLSMAHGLVAQLGGALMIQSRRGVGTNVELWLPLSATTVEETDAVSAPLAPGKARGLALLVDDEDVVRASTADMLQELGYDVQEAESGEAALALVAEGARPDLLVTDHLMPGMTGVDLVRAVRDRLPSLPVLIVSGYAEVEGIAADLPRLTKPFRSDELAAGLAGLSTASVH